MLFLDEIHRMSRPAEEMLYMAMEDFRVDVVVGKGAGATSIPLELPAFTLVGATTRAGLLPGPLRDRFGFTGHLEFYAVEELELVLRRSAGLLDLDISAEGYREIASRSRGTPRIANRLLRRVRDWALVHDVARIDARAAGAALDMYEVDPGGWTGWTAPCCRPWWAPSAGDRWACPPWPSPWGRRPRPWRPSPSRTWCARG
ncbi:Holliday junction ATP-dependent DNA helicase RuvB [Rothia kristinae]|nr:Holliday junction ATP-dependent DNA helicase RuvB [Rothia kristinae]